MTDRLRVRGTIPSLGSIKAEAAGAVKLALAAIRCLP